MLETIRLQQALFGYRDGHNLLTSSVSLPPRVRHFLATVTDSPSTETADGFDYGYTGVFVPETDYYALFRTWPAPEMPRPGCVWSHVLLVELSDLARIPDLLVLRNHCKRPDVNSRPTFTGYDRELSLEHDTNSRLLRPNIDCRRAPLLLRLLYEQSESGVVILDSQCLHWEEIIFAIWSQQWPRLRRNFAFSTSSLGDRRLAGVNFDLQIAPLKSERLWHRKELPTFVFGYTNDTLESPTKTNWLEVALQDLASPGHSQLRGFFQNYGSDLDQPRRAFVQLVRANIVLNDNLGWNERLRSVAAIFPKESDALRLKESLLTQDGTMNIDREWEIAAFLLSSQGARAFAKVSFDHVRLAPDLWNQKREKVLDLIAQLVRREENPTSTTFAKAISECVTTDDLPWIANRHPEIIPVFISHRIELAYEAGTWQLPGYVQSQIFEALEGMSLSQERWAIVMGAMFIAASYVSVAGAVRHAGSSAMNGAFRWLDTEISDRLLPSREWRYALSESATHRLESSEIMAPPELALCCWIVSSDTLRRQLHASREDLLELSNCLKRIPKALQSYAAFVLVTVGLRSRGPEGLHLLKRGYFHVQEVLAKSQATEEEWELLAPEVPKIGWCEWDRCEKLRRATRDWFAKFTKEQNPLLDAASTPREMQIAHELTRPNTKPPENDWFID